MMEQEVSNLFSSCVSLDLLFQGPRQLSQDGGLVWSCLKSVSWSFSTLADAAHHVSFFATA